MKTVEIGTKTGFQKKVNMNCWEGAV